MKKKSTGIGETSADPSGKPLILDGARASARHRALAEPTRAMLLALVRRTDAPLAAPELAAACGLHPSTVRAHLAVLVDVGLVRTYLEERHRRGRPRRLYAATRGGGDELELAAGVLVRALGSVSGAPQLAERAGRDRGRELGDDPPPGTTAVERLVALLGEGGFEPIQAEDGTVAMHRCPLRALADAEPAVVCGLHRGIVEGYLERAAPELRLIGFEPRAAPRPCLLRVEPRGEARR